MKYVNFAHISHLLFIVNFEHVIADLDSYQNAAKVSDESSE